MNSAGCFELISNNNATNKLPVPDIKRINNIREFMADPANFDGNIDNLTESIASQAAKCRELVTLLKEQVLEKTSSLRQIKADMLKLQSDLKLPNAANRFALDREKIVVKFEDEPDAQSYDVPQALERYSLKMSTLFGEILALDSDVDYVVYLEGIAQVNKQYVRDWYEREHLAGIQEKPLDDDAAEVKVEQAAVVDDLEVVVDESKAVDEAVDGAEYTN